MATLLTTDNRRTTIAPANGRASFTLDELQHYVHGFIEVLYLSDGSLLVVHEEGRFATKPVLNAAATGLYGRALLVGDAVHCTRAEMGEDDDKHVARAMLTWAVDELKEPFCDACQQHRPCSCDEQEEGRR